MKQRCEVCFKQFKNQSTLSAHKSQSHGKYVHSCSVCSKSINRKHDFLKHSRNVHGTPLESIRKRKLVDGNKHEPKQPKFDHHIYYHAPKVLLDDLESRFNPPDHYNLEFRYSKHAKNLKTHFDLVKINFSELDQLDVSELLPRLYLIFQSIMKKLTRHVSDHDYVRFSLHSSSLNSDLQIPFVPLREFSVNLIFNVLTNLLQSYQSFRLDDTCFAYFTWTELPKNIGGINLKNINLPLDKFKKIKRCIYSVRSHEKICSALALDIGRKVADNKAKKLTSRCERLFSVTSAKQLFQLAGLPEGEVSLGDFKAFGIVLNNYCITIYSALTGQIIFRCNEHCKKEINLLMSATSSNEHHVDVILSVKALFNRRNYCSRCRVSYNQIHNCQHQNACKLCRNSLCENQINATENEACCVECKFVYKTTQCFLAHIGSCTKYEKCLKCKQKVKKKNISTTMHDCKLTRYCQICELQRSRNHQTCFIPTYQYRPKEVVTLFYDSETDVSSDPNGEHLLICACVQNQSGQEDIFETPDCERKVATFFLEYAHQQKPKKVIVISHFGGSYDLYWVVKGFISLGIIPRLIFRGSKMLSVSLNGGQLCFKDSYLFMPMKLSDCPKNLGLPDCVMKGWQPYTLVTESNWTNYDGKFPDISDFDKKVRKNEIFLDWYASEKMRHIENNMPYDLRKTTVDYMRNDVTVLRLACEKFDELFFKLTGIRCFNTALTIAASCSLAFRKDYLKQDSLAVIGSYTEYSKRKHSLESYTWLTYMTQTEGKYIHHGYNGREKFVGGYPVDGVHVTKDGKKEIYQYSGCYFHGNPCCYEPHVFNKKLKKRMGELYLNTVNREEYFRNLGHTVITATSCDYKKLFS